MTDDDELSDEAEEQTREVLAEFQTALEAVRSLPAAPQLGNGMADRRDRWAWAAALALYVFGDGVTTALGLSLGAVETNPAALALIGAVGLWPAMLLLKAAVLGFVGVLWGFSPAEWRAVAPASLAMVGAAVVVINARVLALAGGVA